MSRKEVVTNVSEFKKLVWTIRNLTRTNPIGEEMEQTYQLLLKVVLDNIDANKEDLVVEYDEAIKHTNNQFEEPLSTATDRERAFYNVGKARGIFDIIQSLGKYEQCINKFLSGYFNIEVGDIVYVRLGNVTYKTTVIQKKKEKLQVAYGNRWFDKYDFLEILFPESEKKNLIEKGLLKDCNSCDNCTGFRNSKCAYGYKVRTFKGHSYRFDNTRYDVTKGTPLEDCSKTIKQ